jgi:hypothetical protein
MSCFDEVAMSCIIYMVNYSFVTHAIYSLALMMFKYNELQMSSALEKVSCKANCKIPFFLIMNVNFGRN